MYAVAFMLIGLCVAGYARITFAPVETEILWLATVFGAVLVVQLVVFLFKQRSRIARIRECLSEYGRLFGDSSSGKKFLEGAEPWVQQLGSELALSGLFSWDLHSILLGGVLSLFGELFDGKSLQQRCLEEKMKGLSQNLETAKRSFLSSTVLGALAILAIGFATSTTVVPPPIDRYADVAQSQQEAVRRYPALGRGGSDVNREFLTRYARYKAERPDFVKDTEWPLRLVTEIVPPEERRLF